MNQEFTTVNLLVKCMCVLHNLIIDLEGAEEQKEDCVLETVREDQISMEEPGRRSKKLGEEVREKIKTYVGNNPI